jgi:hypothetical protein
MSLQWIIDRSAQSFLITCLTAATLFLQGCLFPTGPARFPVTSITVTGTNGVTNVVADATLQLSAAVLPQDATDPAVS